jgi:hypothetical protein
LFSDYEISDIGMIFDNCTVDFKKNKFRFDCVEMKLVQDRSLQPIMYKGKGFIEQNENGELNFKLYVNEFENTNCLNELNSMFAEQSGKLYVSEDYFALTVTAETGVIWHAKRILPKCCWSTNEAIIITGNIRSIDTSNAQVKCAKHILCVHFFQDFEMPFMPCENDTAVEYFDYYGANVEFKVSNSESGVIVRATSDFKLPDSFALKIQEAIMFITATPAVARVVTISRPEGAFYELVSAPQAAVKPSMYSPLGRSYLYRGNAWRLFVVYLKYICLHSELGCLNHITYHVRNAVESSANSMDAFAVAVSVSVEGLANLVEVPTNLENKEFIREFREFLLPIVAQSEKFSLLQDRLKGLLSMMGNPRVTDRLQPLSSNGHVTKEYVKAWKYLRHKHAHPKADDLRSLSEGNMQEFWTLINKVTTLMYEIVFHLIGYVGPYTDFGRLGFPEKNYPLQVPAVSGIA